MPSETCLSMLDISLETLCTNANGTFTGAAPLYRSQEVGNSWIIYCLVGAQSRVFIVLTNRLGKVI